MIKAPSKVLMATTALVGLSAIVSVCVGSATNLSDLVGFGGIFIGASISSYSFMSQHTWLIYLMAFFVNMAIFLMPAASMWLVLRNKKPLLCIIFLFCWCLLYLALLFFLFPVTVGP